MNRAATPLLRSVMLMSMGLGQAQPAVCHPERSEGSALCLREILRFAQDDIVRSLRLMPIGRSWRSPCKPLYLFSGLFYVITFQPHDALVFAEPG
jgi:hypothetical protein